LRPFVSLFCGSLAHSYIFLMLKRKLSCHPIIIHPCWEKKEKKVSGRSSPETQAVGFVEDCEEEKKKGKKERGTVRPKCHHSVVRHHRPRAPR
jgi:hypothetical protein